MGIIWRIAMPLLSTLAALVIIVHSAEEDLEQEYRYDLRPRALNTEPGSYEQPWRVMKPEPVIKHPAGNAWSQDSHEEQPKRRRKRKRRPIETSDEDLATQERFTYPETPPKENENADYDSVYQTTEPPRRRRKRINTRTNRWADEAIAAERPIRRRGNRRKRPSVETWPKLSEFSEHHREPSGSEEIHARDGEIYNTDEYSKPTSRSTYDEYPYHQNIESKSDIVQQTPNDQLATTTHEANNDDKVSTPPLQENKSLPEYSIESHEQPTARDNTLKAKIRKMQKQKNKIEKLHAGLKSKMKSVLSPKQYKSYCKGLKYDYNLLKRRIEKFKCTCRSKIHLDIDVTDTDLTKNKKIYSEVDSSRNSKSKESELKIINLPKKYRILRNSMTPKKMLRDNDMSMEVGHSCWSEGYLNPLLLKEILKRSNGSSLSEILQQHNLTLADLLHGKENALTILNSEDTLVRRKDVGTEAVTEPSDVKEPREIEALESKNPSSINNKIQIDVGTENTTPRDPLQDVRIKENKESEVTTADQPEKESNKKETDNEQHNLNKPNGLRYMNRRRFPTGMQKRLRLRPILNNTFKGQLSRDMVAIGLKRFPNRRNITKSQEWKSMIPLLVTSQPNNESHDSENDTEVITTTTAMTTTISTTFDDTTIVIDFDKPDPEVVTIIGEKLSNVKNTYIEIPGTDLTEAPITTSESPTTIVHFNLTERPIVTPIVRQLNASGLRRTAFNRLKKKRLKQKNSTTESPHNDVTKNIIGISNLEFIAKTTTLNKQTNRDDEKDMDALEDFMTTALSRHTESSTRSTKYISSSIRPLVTTKATSIWRPTEETAEIEIEELLNDTRTSARLSKILMERNMTLTELVEHRERGSSHVHLADIFHNASKEPNPPEPFLSKSLIEPISKETYPLRALLDANLHDPTVKATTIDPTLSHTNYIHNIPIVMDFGNNVNENAENMGIMSLFNNFTNSVRGPETTLHYSENVPHETNSINNNTTNVNDLNRESRTLDDNQDMVSWNDIFSMIRKGHNNETEHIENFSKDMTPSATYKKITLEEDVDGDGLIVLEDLQHLNDFDSNIASGEKLEIYEGDSPRKPGVLNIPGSTKSVTVATASIVGLSMVLFLLTYATFKWIQQKKKEKKRNFPNERIPTPVFENRKGHKNNSSTRSISPMLSSSNIYTMNTLESHHGKDSPEYMWDTLRKPFQ